MDDFRTNELGAFLRARREQLSPADLPGGARPSRRRTPGVRRSEIAALADISVEWLTRLEQGRGGRPSMRVLDAVCDALQVRPEEREHAFLLAYGSAATALEEPDAATRARLQQLVDQLAPWPAYVKSSCWDVVVWNADAARALSDYSVLAPQDRNVLRILFLAPESRDRIDDWGTEAQLAVATFRAELARWGGHSPRAMALVKELADASPEFRRFWQLNTVGYLGDREKTFLLRDGTSATMRYESLGLDANRGLSLVVYTPVPAED
ncbi:helix-turn-helix transcriptional regulator [Streptomyces sp. TRM 70361]|uniref:helix-turn-helix transcriptional regulator n=1 Tax=Streptomyces sp. TRM 70361 TaxID=3116553 RepID=UPI002E7B985B|nr:helix-turn-helix transcriptional regulator [Streptomyces sp. TRM 70361]MEE1938683.1 helix-turn-helix transcriptional regulator [Streptomyces sp. TRM 70361]